MSDSVLAAEDGVAMRLSRSYDELAETRRTFFSHPMMSEPNEMEREAESERQRERERERYSVGARMRSSPTGWLIVCSRA